jgi:hypothetical protein
MKAEKIPGTTIATATEDTEAIVTKATAMSKITNTISAALVSTMRTTAVTACHTSTGHGKMFWTTGAVTG